MIDRRRNTTFRFKYDSLYYLMSITLILSAAIGSAVAQTTAVNAETKEVSFTETSSPTYPHNSNPTNNQTSEQSNEQSNNGDAGESVPIGDYIVTVAPGDTLSSILRENLGSLSALQEIIRYNNLQTPDALPPGKKILIPVYLFSSESASVSEPAVQTDESEKGYLVVDLAELASSTNPVTTAQTPGSDEQYLVVDLTELSSASDRQSNTQSTESEGLYKVVDLTDINATPDRKIRVNRGDSLSSILRENLGSLRALQEVTRYNNLQAPDELQPGQIILIPGYIQL